MSTLSSSLPLPAATSQERPVAVPLTTLQKLLIPAGAILFDVLFWQQGVGLNLALYTAFVVAATVAGLPRHAPVWHSSYFRLLLLGTLLSTSGVLWTGSAAAQLACVASLIMLLGYVNQPHLKLVVYALLTALAGAARAVPGLLPYLRLPRSGASRWSRTRFYGRLLVLPVVVLGVFHLLFSVANPRYDALASAAFARVGEWLLALLPGLSPLRVLFFGLGLVLTAGALVVVPFHFFQDQESRLGEFVRRQRDRVASFGVRRPDFRNQSFRVLDLRKEYLAALAVFGLVNLLLLIVNLIDINWIWFGFEPSPGFDLTQFVHEGTYVLILSILVAMGIVLWFFRRNLNFYAPGLVLLRWGATVWTVQNAVLVVSVGLRNYYYIVHTGLAYKRIGVYGFLLLTVFGLVTVLLKVWQRRSAYGLVRLNSLAAYCLLLVLALGNWEVWIVRYNLQPRFQTVDLGFLLNMPERVLPEVAARQDVLSGMTRIILSPPGTYTETTGTPEQGRAAIQARIEDWRRRYPRYHSWHDWTYAESRAFAQLSKP
ncbi:DUF4153 domain-containing protein [Hymenobacter weizhouensis]|uniref:DUF4153 domain-containing protein n=1 Tax=Hymenobacter sp. YIM 151500-1 TaxID=2987689 RepID=UPI002226FAD8|nr:DUF4173 domain-containing protein [Hymenobacter sp. YIM 151500-1]UYZ63186.1 DUF4173 domain-containing protein [Hymenobacter sp. YIM 151500-1]